MKKAMMTFLIILLVLALTACQLGASNDEVITDIEDLTKVTVELQEKVEKLEMLQSTREKEISNLRSDYPVISADLARTEELLNKMDGLETVHGIITSIDKEEEVSFSILVVEVDKDGQYQETKQNREIECTSDFIPYMAGQYALLPIASEEFIILVEEYLKNDVEVVFIFKIVKEKAVQIYQG